MGSAGKWVDKNVLQDKWVGIAFPGLMAYQAAKGKGFFEKPKAPDVGTPPPPVDITDQAVQAKLREEDFRTGSGSRRNSFITGPLGDQTNIPVMGKSIITGG